ncbi:MAG: hypothetical protein WCP21_09670 [Armatimonadota bacterium]
MRLTICSLVIIMAMGGLTMHGFAQPAQRFVQDRFAIGFWVDPPLDDRADERYAEIAAANFTLVIGGFGGNTAEKVKRQVALCEKYDLRGVVARAGVPPDQLPDSPAVWGYSLRDEPPTGDFPALRADVDAIRAARPGKLAYINLLPNYANAAQLGAPTYDEHVSRFVKEVATDVLSMDYYPMLTPGADGRDGYCSNLETMRKYSLQENIPFWNFFNCMPYGPHYDPTEADLRWQIYTSVAYGARGVLYFCYFTPVSPEFPKGGAIIRTDGRRTRHYYEAQRINAGLKHLGPVLMQLKSVSVNRVSTKTDPAPALAGTPLKSLSGQGTDYLLGVFQHQDGRRAVLLNNYDRAYAAWPTVEFDVDPAQVMEVSPETGKIEPVLDDSPEMPGLQLSLDAGAGRLFLLPAK